VTAAASITVSPFTLASASPRRLALLAQAGIVPARVIAPDIDERPRKSELPRAYALRLALAKAGSVAERATEAPVLAADTVVACGRRILPKAETAEEVERCLRLLSGRRHQVLTPTEIGDYLMSGEGIGKAGGYAIQGRAEAFVRFINGSYSNVVGLPLYETLSLLG